MKETSDRKKCILMWLYLLLGIIALFFSRNVCLFPSPRFLGEPAKHLVVMGILIESFVFLVAFIMTIYYTIVVVIKIIQKKIKYLHVNKLAVSFVLFVLCILLTLITSKLLHNAFLRASLNGEKIINALSNYRKNTGEYPENLEKLIPDYMDDIPFTGLIGYPCFTYSKTKDSDSQESSYELGVYCMVYFLDPIALSRLKIRVDISDNSP
jgi:hypothetical protein